MWDVVVAGGGPAGAAAAYVLARRGRRVLLADDVDPCVAKIGEALPGAAVRLLRSIGLPVPEAAGPHRPIGGNLSCWNAEHPVASDFFCSPDGPGWRLDRARFDADLRAAAIRAGARYRAARVTNPERRGAGWSIGFGDHAPATSQWLIDATGRRAAIARRQGATRLRDAPLIALYAVGRPPKAIQLDRTVIEAARHGWWYAAGLPSGQVVAGFHTHHRAAHALLTQPGRWREALRDTRHAGSMLADALFEHPPRAVEAGGARLDRCRGDRWIACGDAALSFDPVSGQGIFAALHGGMTAAHAVDEALGGGNEKLAAYSARLDHVRRHYVAHCRAVYGSEQRWRDAPFWTLSRQATRHGGDHDESRADFRAFAAF